MAVLQQLSIDQCFVHRREFSPSLKNQGRKPAPRARVRHRERVAVRKEHPAHVTLCMRRDVPLVRNRRWLRTCRERLERGCDCGDFRVARPRSWLLAKGWPRGGSSISLPEIPGQPDPTARRMTTRITADKRRRGNPFPTQTDGTADDHPNRHGRMQAFEPPAPSTPSARRTLTRSPAESAPPARATPQEVTRPEP